MAVVGSGPVELRVIVWVGGRPAYGHVSPDCQPRLLSPEIRFSLVKSFSLSDHVVTNLKCVNIQSLIRSAPDSVSYDMVVNHTQREGQRV